MSERIEEWYGMTWDDMTSFHQGIHYEIYKKLGAHYLDGNRFHTLHMGGGQMCQEIGLEGTTYFCVYAPAARSVSVIGDFNGWDRESTYLWRVGESGFFEGCHNGAVPGTHYKYAIETQAGELLFKADPYARRHGFRPDNTSVVSKAYHDVSREPAGSVNSSYTFQMHWTDSEYIARRNERSVTEKPISIYEVQIGSWKRHPNGPNCGYYNYRTFADEIVSYFREFPYTHVELIGILEYPFDASWGYQVTGYYAPTSRYGSFEDFLYMINTLHTHGIGVILDWVPAHFPKDAHGLSMFDGTPLYEYADPRKGEHPDWGTKIFDYTKPEVRNFLIASALFFIEVCHVDGLRVDAVSSMLYLDYGRGNGQWVPNIYGGKENLEAIEFFRHLNSIAALRNPGVMMIAEESTAWEGVTKPAGEQGLHFDLKWNMGWMHDFLDYMQTPPDQRKVHHHKLTFGMSYHYSENFVLVLSHDEVVHGKGTLLEKMAGYEPEKYANLKLAYSFMYAHPGKKLLFMGQEFAQRREWSEERELDWYLYADDTHRQVAEVMKRLLSLYRSTPAMYEGDQLPQGFEWLNADDSKRSIYRFVRRDKNSTQVMVCIFNFTYKEQVSCRIGVPLTGAYRIIFDTDSPEYGGQGIKQVGQAYPTERIQVNQWEQSICISLMPYEGLYLLYEG